MAIKNEKNQKSVTNWKKNLQHLSLIFEDLLQIIRKKINQKNGQM